MMRRLTLAVVTCAALAGFGCDEEATGGGSEPMALPADPTRDMGSFVPDPPGDGMGGGGGPVPDMGSPAPDVGGVPPVDQPCADEDLRPCADGCGMQTCAAGAWGACAPSIETCNDLDDDCDGSVDESFVGKGNGCTSQQEGCTVQGTRICSPDGTGLICQVGSTAPQVETCDGTDEDCDGEVDEDFPGQRCCTEDFHCPPSDMCDGGQCVPRGGVGPGGDPGFPPPGQGGDVCAAAQQMNGFGQFRGDNTFAPAELFGGCGGFLGGEVAFWFELEAPERVRLDTEGSPADTVLYVQQECGNALSEIDCDDDGGSGLTSVIELNARAGLRYYVIVDSALLGGGDFVLNFDRAADAPGCSDDSDCARGEQCRRRQCVPVAPTGCVDGLDCRLGEICEAGECVPGGGGGVAACDAPVEMAMFGNFAGDTSGAGDQGAPSCQEMASGPEQVFTFTLDRDAQIELETTAQDFDPVLSVRTACDDVGTEIGCDDDGGERPFDSLVRFDARAGQRYFVVVDGFSGDRGAFDLRFGEVGAAPDPPDPPADGCEGACEADETCASHYCVPAPPAICAGAIPVHALGRFEGSTVGAHAQIRPGTCGSSDSPEAIYVFVLDEPATVTASTEGSDFDTVLYAGRWCEREVACNDDADAGSWSSITFRADARIPYYVIVDGYHAQTGNYVLTLTAQ